MDTVHTVSSGTLETWRIKVDKLPPSCLLRLSSLHKLTLRPASLWSEGSFCFLGVIQGTQNKRVLTLYILAGTVDHP